MLRKELSSDFFIAHIGGDDFFCGINNDEKKSFKGLSSIVQKFEANARDFYSKEDKKNGYVTSTGRESSKQKFPLLTVSASIVVVNEHTRDRTVKNINQVLAAQKKVAKSEINHISLSSIL